MPHLHPNRILPEAGVHRNRAESGIRQSTEQQCLDIDDVISSNRYRREITEPNTSRKPNGTLLRCRRPVILASFNACTAREEHKVMEIAHCAQSCGIEILGVQEHRRVHKDKNDIIKFVCNLIAGKSSGHDGITVTILKWCLPYITYIALYF